VSWADRDWYDARWQSIPAETRERIVGHLRANLTGGQLEQIRELHSADPDRWAHPFHLLGFMAVRNLLREIIRDDELPDAPYPGGETHRNWDDYYVQALEAAAGVRDA
jgi:hypothetical protein